MKDISTTQIEELFKNSYESFLCYSRISNTEKSKFLEAIINEIEKIGTSVVLQAVQETNLSEIRLQAELQRTIKQLHQFADLVREGSWVEARIDSALPNRKPISKPDLRKMMVPLGPVVVFGAGNFPLAYSTAGVDTASALASGCSVVVKAHPAHPKTSDLVAGAIDKAIKRCQMPEFVFQQIHGASFELGKQLVQHPIAKAVGFTGSFSGGMAIFSYASQRHTPIPVFAEMGSLNPIFILPEALKNKIEKVVEILVASITQSSGQFCTKPGLILGVENSDFTKFVSILIERIKQVKPEAMLHQSIADKYFLARKKALAQTKVRTETELSQKESEMTGVPTIASVKALDFVNNPILLEEVFGPYSLIVLAKDETELLSVLNNISGQLTVSIFANESDLGKYKSFVQCAAEKAGRVIFNGVPTGVEVSPAMNHGGPFPATTDSRFTSVGTDAIKRFVRPVTFQNFPDSILPDELKDDNPLKVSRFVDNKWVIKD